LRFLIVADLLFFRFHLQHYIYSFFFIISIFCLLPYTVASIFFPMTTTIRTLHVLIQFFVAFRAFLRLFSQLVEFSQCHHHLSIFIRCLTEEGNKLLATKNWMAKSPLIEKGVTHTLSCNTLCRKLVIIIKLINNSNKI